MFSNILHPNPSRFSYYPSSSSTQSVSNLHTALVETYSQTITAVIDAGADVTAALATHPTDDAEAIRRPLDSLLRQRELLGQVLSMLDTGASAVGEQLQGAPVPAPPYLAVTSRGPVCRGTLSDGRRLVLELRLFAVESRPRQYRFRAPDPENCLAVELKQ